MKLIIPSSDLDNWKNLYYLLEQLEKQYIDKVVGEEDLHTMLKVYYANGLRNKETATKLGITPNTFNKRISRLSDRYLKLYTDKLPIALEQKDVTFLSSILTQQSKNLTIGNILMTELISKMPYEQDSYDINLFDCSKEISVLKLYSTQMLETQVQSCDSRKLAFLMTVLNGSGGTHTLKRKALRDYLTGNHVDDTGEEITYTDFLTYLQEMEY